MGGGPMGGEVPWGERSHGGGGRSIGRGYYGGGSYGGGRSIWGVSMEEGGGPIEGRSHGRGRSHGVGGHHGGVPMDGGGVPWRGGVLWVGGLHGGAPWGGVPPERHGAYSTNLEKLPMERKQVPTGSRPPSSLMGRQLYRGAQAWGGGTGKRGARGGLCIYKHTAPPYPPPPHPIPGWTRCAPSRWPRTTAGICTPWGRGSLCRCPQSHWGGCGSLRGEREHT